MKKKSVTLVMLLLLVCSIPALISCRKFLDEKPDKKLAVPATTADVQALLDYYNHLVLDPAADEVSADDYYVTTATWQALSKEEDRRLYTWQKDYVFVPSANDWFTVYRNIYYYNTVLDHLQKITVTPENEAEWKHVKGQALMLRGRAFLQVINIWALAYDKASANTDLGIPLRLNSDFTEISVRASVQQSFNQIISDLKVSIPLLPARATHVIRASRSAAFAFLARTYLAMQDYSNAGLYADSCLQLYNNLLDYNSLNAAATYPVPQFNPEMLFYSVQLPSILSNSRAKIDSVLYSSYAVNDCRKTVFFKSNGDGTYGFKGSYDGNSGSALFTGIATDEVYLIRAECHARAGNKNAALADLNALLVKRYKTGTFIYLTAVDANEALAKILVERRKQLLMRCIRWMDIKRLNKEGAAISCKRLVNNQTYLLLPNDLRFALPIPEVIIEMTGMQQNPR